MRRLDGSSEIDLLGPETEGSNGLALDRTTRPDSLSLGDPRLSVGNAADPLREYWRERIDRLGGPSPLLHFVDEPRTRIELSTTHPGGLPQFITGHRTVLSSLLRDELALRSAKLAAGAITTKAVELRTVRGIDAIHLAIGLAEWRHGGQEYRAPVLLKPVAIRRYGRDFELKLRGRLQLNPELARALHEQFRITLDGDAFVALATTDGVFKPQPVIDRLRGLTGHLPWFSVHARLLVSSFADVAGPMRADARDLDHPVLDAIAGNPAARTRLESAYEPVEIVDQDHRSPATDALLLDSDEEQERVVAQISAGNSLVVKTLPGTGGTQTIVNAIGSLVAQHKRVLVVGARRPSLDAITRRLDQLGLGGIAAGPRTLKRDLIKAISRNEKASRPQVSDVDDALVRLRTVLIDYRTALTRPDPALGVSVLDALEALARLTRLDTPPSTTARLERDALEALAEERESTAQALAKAAALGEFRYGPDDSPWYGASFTTSREADEAHALAQRLSTIELPRLLERAESVIRPTRMRPYQTIRELGVYLRLLADLRETLDKFVPAVYDRPLTELIAATAPRRDSPEMSSANRRRLRRLAYEYVRPGVHVADINESLRRIQDQRLLWQRYAATGVPPKVPVGIADAQVAYQRVAADLAELDQPLGRHTSADSLLSMPLDRLERMLAGLAEESEVLANLQERTALLSHLRDRDLGPLLTDLSQRHVPEAEVADELELAWWQSVLELFLAENRALLGANTEVLDRLEADFRLVDEAHAKASPALLAHRLAEAWKVALVDWPEEAKALRRLLRGDAVTVSDLCASAPHLIRSTSPVWVCSPYDVPGLPTDERFDALVVVDAGSAAVEEVAGAIRRSRQLVAFGDPVTQTPSPFQIAVSAGVEEQPVVDVDAEHAGSALARLADLLPVFTLTRSYRAGGEDLATLVNRRFYGDRIETLPWAGTFLGRGTLTLHYVEGGRGMPDADSGAVESVDAEVERVVDLVLAHAESRRRESLMVVTASARHAVRLHHAVVAAFSRRTHLSDFLLADRAEPFTIVTLEQSVGLSRDRVVFSVGYGRTPHGRLLSNFGALAEPGGERLLAVGMSRARRGMDIVSCFHPDEIDSERMRHGVVALARLLSEADALTSEQDPPAPEQPLIADLAARLRRRGLTVQLGYRGKLPLVASHGTKAVAVETDSTVAQASLRESIRLRPQVLRRLGWHYLRVHSFDLFSEPEAVAARIARLIGVSEPETATGPIELPNAG